MTLKTWLRTEYVPILLVILMTITRYHHFGDVLHLPDASLAVFFFAGFYRKKALLGFLLVLAGVIDYLAIANGTSSYCVSPGYVFLIPTYAIMWFVARQWASLRLTSWRQLATSAAWLLVASGLAFVVSNVGFYGFSGKFADLSLWVYSTRVAQFLPLYLASTVVYGLLVWAGVHGLETLLGHKPQQGKTE